MAIIFLRPIVNERINGKHEFQTLDLEISNTGKEQYDVLIQGYHDNIPFYLSLYALHPAPDTRSTLRINHLHADFGNIAFQFTTNIHSCASTEIKVIGRDLHGNAVRTFVKEDCAILEL